MKNKHIKKYDIGDKAYVFMSNKLKCTILKIIDVEATIVIYKWWDKHKQLWCYEGKKFTEFLFWNSLMYEMDNDERCKYFKLNGFDYNEVKDTDETDKF